MRIPIALVTALTTGLLLLCGAGTALLGGALPGGCVQPVAMPASGAASAAASPVCVPGAWTQPVRAPVVSGFRTASRPGHDGVDLGAARYTPIRAAAAGTVLVARCDASTGDCDRDGSPSTPGCGWFLDIRHPGDVITRYCHLASRPAVGAGDPVTTGQIIGVVGSSGHSSGPHLHFEVHLHGERSSAAAVDPEPFMADRGAPLR